MPKKDVLSMGMQSTILWIKFKVRCSVSCSQWTVRTSSMIAVTSVWSIWRREIGLRISRRRDVGEWLCIGWPASYTRFRWSVGWYRPISLICWLILRIQSSRSVNSAFSAMLPKTTTTSSTATAQPPPLCTPQPSTKTSEKPCWSQSSTHSIKTPTTASTQAK